MNKDNNRWKWLEICGTLDYLSCSDHEMTKSISWLSCRCSTDITVGNGTAKDTFISPPQLKKKKPSTINNIQHKSQLTNKIQTGLKYVIIDKLSSAGPLTLILGSSRVYNLPRLQHGKLTFSHRFVGLQTSENFLNCNYIGVF